MSQALFLCAPYLSCPTWKMLTFSQGHSLALTNATRRHEYFQGLSRLLPVLVSFLELQFHGKGTFLQENEYANETKTLALSKSAKETGNICDRLWHLPKRG